MTFSDSDLNFVLEFIEESMSFQGEDLTSPQDWNLKIDLKVQSLIDKEPGKANTIRYIVKTLESLGYIKFKHCDYSTIADITASGLKLIFSKLHNLEFNY